MLETLTTVRIDPAHFRGDNADLLREIRALEARGDDETKAVHDHRRHLSRPELEAVLRILRWLRSTKQAKASS
jgi:hypothetical protein